MVKCANPECEHHRPTGFFESLWASTGFVFDGQWFCSNACYKKSTRLGEPQAASETAADKSSAVDMTNMRLGEVLVACGIVGSEELAACVANRERSDRRIGQVLVESGLVTREAILAALSKQKGAPWVDVFILSYDDAALALLSFEDAKKEQALPFGFVDGQVLVATSAVGDKERLAGLERRMGWPIRPLFSPEEELATAIDQAYCTGEQLGREKKVRRLSPSDRRLGQIMLVEGVITPSQLEQALLAQEDDAARLGHILLRLGFIEEEELVRVLGKQCGCMWLDLSSSTIPARTIDLLSREIAHEFRVVPVKYSDEVLDVATDDPTDRARLRRLESRLSRRIVPVVCATSQLTAALEKYYGKKDDQE